jgi:hypothetical protein
LCVCNSDFSTYDTIGKIPIVTQDIWREETNACTMSTFVFTVMYVTLVKTSQYFEVSVNKES